MRKVVTKFCEKCGKPYIKKDEGWEEWNSRRFCSLKCCYSTPRSQEVKERIRETCKKNCPGWTKGKKRPLELRVLHSQRMKERVASGTHNFWKGGIAQQNRTFKANFQNTLDYRLWRTAVFTRDNYSCVRCGDRNGNGHAVILHADHIKSFAEYPKLRLQVSNGRTLCRECHYKRHSKQSICPPSQPSLPQPELWVKQTPMV